MTVSAATPSPAQEALAGQPRSNPRWITIVKPILNQSPLVRRKDAETTSVMGRFLTAMKTDPKGTAELVQAGFEDERHAYGIAVAITLMLAKAAEVPHA